MKTFKKTERLPFFIIFLPVFYLLHIVTGYSPIVRGSDLFQPIAAWMVGLPLLLYILIVYFRPSLLKYSAFFLYLEFIYFFFGALHDFCIDHIPVISRYSVLLPVLLIVTVVLFYRTRKLKNIPGKFFLYLNTLFVVLITIEIIQFVALESTHGRSRFWLSGELNSDKVTNCDSCEKPDIFFIVFDGYSGSRTLKQYWNYDNSGLDSFFRRNDFFLSDSSTSNYNFTAYSIGSILNLNYHRRKFNRKMDILQFVEGIQTIQTNYLCRYLARNGYTIINPSFFPLPGADPAFNIAYLSNKKNILLFQTLPAQLLNDVGWHFGKSKLMGAESDEEKLARIRPTIQEVRDVHKNLLTISQANRNTPAFVYAHFMIPHDPYFFDSTGNLTSDKDLLNERNEKESYLSQLKYCNTLIKDIVPHLLHEGNRPRIILIQSDHGYRSFENNMGDSLEFRNLNAIYFPDKQYQGLYNSMSSVNIFRIILHKYFKQSLPLLKDSTVYIRR